MIRMPVHITQRERKIARVEQELSLQLERTPTEQEVARAAKLSPKQVKEVHDAARAVTSLDRPTGEDDGLTLGDVFMSEDAEPEELVEVSLTQETLRRAVEALPDREREVVKLRYGLSGTEDPKSIEDVVRTLGISRDQVRKLERLALGRLAEMREVEALNVAV